LDILIQEYTNYAIKILILTYFQEVSIEQTLNIFGKNINEKEY